MLIKEINMDFKKVKDNSKEGFHFERVCSRGFVQEREINLNDVNCMSDSTHIIGVLKEHYVISNESYHKLKKEMKKNKLLERLSLERV